MRSPNTHALFLASFAALGTFLFGYDTGIAITITDFPSWQAHMHHPSKALLGAVPSCYAAGQALGVLLQLAVADRLGRVRFLQLLCVITTLGTCLTTAAADMGVFVAGRAVTGLGAGAMITTVSLYLPEICPPKRRGLLAGFTGVGIAAGLMSSCWVGAACLYAAKGDLQWRLLCGLQIPWAPIFGVGLGLFMPESPRVLVRKGKVDDAKVAFEEVHRGLEGEEVRREWQLMRAQIAFETSKEGKGWKQYWKRIGVVMLVSLLVILEGGPVVGYYQIRLYKIFGASSKTSMLLAGGRGTVVLLSVILINNFLLDQWGRRKLLLWGMAINFLTLIYTAVMAEVFTHRNNTTGKAFGILGVYVFSIFNGGILESVCPMYSAEILPLALRSKVLAISAFVTFSLTGALTEAASPAFSSIHENYLYVFAGCTLAVWIAGYLWFPETKGKTLEEIAAVFGDKVVDENDDDDDRSGVEEIELEVRGEKGSVVDKAKKVGVKVKGSKEKVDLGWVGV